MTVICPVCGRAIEAGGNPILQGRPVHAVCASDAMKRLMEHIANQAAPADGRSGEEFAMDIAIGRKERKV